MAKIDIKTGEVLAEYESMREAAKQNYMGKSNRWEALKYRNGISCGYKWEIIEEGIVC